MLVQLYVVCLSGKFRNNACVCVCVSVHACMHVQMCVIACQTLHLHHLAIYPSDCPSVHLSLWLFIYGSNKEVFEYFGAVFCI